MAIRHTRTGQQLRADAGEARTRVLGLLVAAMVVVGVVALVLTLSNRSGGGPQAGQQPSGRPVGRSSSAPGPSAAPGAPSSTTAPATRATPRATSGAPATPATSRATSGAPATSSPPRTGPASKVVTYTVRRGDNLTVIARWFHQRGYGLVYNWNKSVIGRDPNLIYPGQTIIVSLTGTRMSVSTGSD